MSADAALMEADNAADAAPKGATKARLLTLADVDQRTTAWRKINELITKVESDLGGSDQLSAAERETIEQAAIHGAMLKDIAVRWLRGEPIDPLQYATLSNAQRRLFESVGTKRRPRDVTGDLREYLAAAKPAVPVDAVSGTACHDEAADDETPTSAQPSEAA